MGIFLIHANNKGTQSENPPVYYIYKSTVVHFVGTIQVDLAGAARPNVRRKTKRPKMRNALSLKC